MRFSGRLLNRRRALLALALAALAGCGGEITQPLPPPADAPSLSRAPAATGETIVVTWSSATLQAFRDTRMGPPMGARALAIVHTAMFDAWAAYDGRAVGTRRGGALRRPARERTEENKKRAISYASYRTLVDLFPTERPKFDAVMRQHGYDPADRSTNLSTATGVGNVAAEAVLQYRRHDGSNQFGDRNGGTAYSDYTGYAPVNAFDRITDPTRWQPLFVNGAEQKYLAPHWGLVTPFAMTSASQFRPRIVQKLYPFSGIEKEVDRVIEYTRTMGDREKVIAEYWADGPNSELPPGHWCLFGAYVSQRDRHSIDQDVKMFFALANAVLDASIAAWDSKRHFDSVRPITAVRHYKAGKMIMSWAGPGQGVKLIRGEDWHPYQPATFPTPPFPEYPSGHSTFSAASAEVLRRFTGSDRFGASVTVAAGSSKVEPLAVPAKDVTLSWATFSAAADEAGLSRRYGGIHFAPGDMMGRGIGRIIGAQTYAKAQRYFDGTAR
jgi:hypothetical protein